MVALINEIMGKLGATGCLVALDDTPPFIIRFDFPPTGWKETKDANWDFVGNPGGRLKYPVFNSMGEEKISFKLVFDTTNRNNQLYIENITQAIGRTVYKGVDDRSQTILNASRLDYITHIKSLFNKIKNPKGALIKSVQAASGKILRISQGQSEPNPFLSLLIKSPSEAFIGYVIKAEVTEINSDMYNYCTRIEVDVEFAVMPDVVLNSMRDVLEEIHAKRSIIPI